MSRWGLVLLVGTMTLVMVWPGWAEAGFSKAGTIGAQFLKIGPSARYIGFGGAAVAVADDADGVYWNPAGLVRLGGKQFGFTHVNWITDIQFNLLSFGWSVGKHAVGLGITAMTMGELEVTTAEFPDGTGQFFSANSTALSLTYANQLSDKLAAGITLKYLRESLSEETASGYAFDAGTLFSPGFQTLRIGISLANFGTRMRLRGRELDTFAQSAAGASSGILPAQLEVDAYSLPVMFRIGAAFDFLTRPQAVLTGMLDTINFNDAAQTSVLGLEYCWRQQIALRVGYQFSVERDHFTFGGGLRLPRGTTILQLDYAYTPLGRLQVVHRFSLGVTL